MKYIIIVFLLILVTTIKPKYLGILKFISLEKYLSSSNTKLIQYSLIFAFLIWIIYTLFKKEIISSLTSIQEGMEGSEGSENEDNLNILVNNGDFLSTSWLTIPDTSYITSLNDFTFTIDMAGYWINRKDDSGSSVPGIIGKYNESESTYIIGTQGPNGYAQMVKIEFQINNGLQVRAIDSANRNPDDVSSLTSDNISTHWDNLSTSFDRVTTNYADTDGYGVNNLIINVDKCVATTIDNERDSELPKEGKVLQADKYINCAEAFNRKENSFYNMDKSLEYYEAALNIKLDIVSDTQKDQVAEIYSAMSAIYSDKQVSAGCVTTNEDGEQVRDEEKCAIADEFGREAERLRTEALKYTMGDINNTLASSPEVDSRGIADESIVAGLTVDKVTPRPIYYEPGTVNYGGLGYKPSDVDIAYYNNYKSTPKNLLESDENSHNFGFCKQQDNIMVNIDEKCNKLSKDVCATTECCILMGGEKCINGNAEGPKNRITYSDTSIKNKDFYYYQGKCYGNCT